MDAPKFRFWVRRSPGEGAVYSIRFEVDGGKGLLRVARPGVLVDPPAREFGFEERLTSAQVRASRFLHVWEGGRKRQGYVLSRLTDVVLSELPLGSWEELSVVNDGGFCWLVHRAPEELDASSLEPLEAPRAAPPTDPVELPLAELEPIEAEAAEVVEAAEAPAPEPPTVEELPENLLEAVEVTSDPDSVEPVTAEQVEPAAPGALSEQDVLPDGAVEAFGRPTALVRHLRRDKLRDRLRIAELAAELEAARKALDEALAREVELRARLARYQRRLKARESTGPQ